MNLEQSSYINQDIIIFELKKQIISSGLVNCELFRSCADLKLRENLLKEKFNLKAKFIKFQENRIKELENMLKISQSSYEKLGKFVDLCGGENKNSFLSRKAKIAKPVNRKFSQMLDYKSLKLNGISTNSNEKSILKRHNTYIEQNEINIKVKIIESGLQLQSLFNSQLKQELEFKKIELNKYKTLNSEIQTQFVETYNKEKKR